MSQKIFGILLFLGQLLYAQPLENVRICIVEDYMPFEGYKKKQEHIGFTSSYFEQFEQKMHITIIPIPTRDTSQAIHYLKEKKCDALSIVDHELKDENFLYTSPYIISPLVIAIKSPVPYITDFHNLQDKTLGIENRTIYREKLLDTYPTINRLVPVTSLREGLKEVDRGEIFGQVGTLAEIGYYFFQDYMGELKIAGKTDLVDLELRMAFPLEERSLRDRFEYTIQTLPPSMHYDIVSKWTSISYGVGIPSQLVYRIGLLILLVLAVVSLFVFLLRKKVKSEVEKNKLKDQLMFQQSRLAQMGELLSMIAHQWRQPLASIAGTIISIQLKEEKGNREQGGRYEKEFTKINNHITHLSETIDNFRNFYKPNREKQQTTIKAPVRNALEILESSLLFNGVEIEQTFPTENPITIHLNEVTQVILAIVQNSIDNFRVRKTPHPKITIHAKEEEQYCTVTLCDNGGGIPLDNVEKIFEPYFSTKQNKTNTGLGLYMAKLIIESHNGGVLEVHHSEEGVCFTIKLPKSKRTTEL